MPPLKKSPAPVKITAKKRPSAAVENLRAPLLPAANEAKKRRAADTGHQPGGVQREL